MRYNSEMRVEWILSVVSCVFVAFSPAASAAKGGRCAKGQQQVIPGMPVFRGPGPAFGTMEIIKVKRCVPVLAVPAKGELVLVQLAKEKAGWVNPALQLPDEHAPDEHAPDEEVHANGSPNKLVESAATPVFAAVNLAILAKPKQGALALARVKVGTELREVGHWADGTWRMVEFGKGKATKGWVSKYLLASTKLEEGAGPTAGKGAWSVQALAHEQKEKSKAASAPPALSAKQKGADASAAARADSSEGDIKSQEPASNTPLMTVLGRTSEFYFLLGSGYWSERYRSDAQNDPFHAYDAWSVGGDLALGGGYRAPDFGLVVDGNLDLGFFRYAITVPPADTTSVLVADINANGYVGWRALESDDVDVEAGYGLGFRYIYQQDLPEPYSTSIVDGLFVDLFRPTLAVRSRLGHLGMVVIEASVPMGAYLMSPDPAGLLTANDQTPLDTAPPPLQVSPSADPAATSAEPPPFAPGPRFHFALGAAGKIRYVYPLTPSVHLNVGGHFSARQVVITGPAKRGKAYQNASVVDVQAMLTVGMSFGL